MIYQKSSYKILPRYIETGKDGIWQRKEKLGEKYEVEYYFALFTAFVVIAIAIGFYMQWNPIVVAILLGVFLWVPFAI